MGKASRTKRRAGVKSARRSSGNLGWWVLAGIIVVAGLAMILVSRESSVSRASAEPRPNKDHWHAAIGVNVCGDWLANPPEFHFAAENSSQQAGIHSHGDGLVHIHPYVASEAGDEATVGKFLEYGGWRADGASFEVWDDARHETGDKCGDAAATVRWELNGEAQTGNLSDYKPKDGDVIALALLPEDDEIGEPPSVASLAAPVDVEPGAGTPSPGVTVPPGATDTSGPAPGPTTAPPASTGETPASSTP
jgi:hypothetical protein